MAKDKFKDEEEIKKHIQSVEGTGEEVGVGTPIQKTKEPLPWHKKESVISAGNQIGRQTLNIKELPTQGLFYPEGTTITIRAATAGEIRHWSTLDETDLASLDDMLNYVIERCVSVKYPAGHSSWKDLKEVDRFYIILAVHELTFINGENKLQVAISETKKLDVKKEMVDYITIDEKLMKFYDPDKRCFIISLPGATPFEITLPTVGVTNWIKNYVIRKRQRNEPIEEDFISFAPFIIQDWKGLSDTIYENYVMESETWSIQKISAISWLKDAFIETVEPVIKYQEENGGERKVPLNFQGGIKSIFLISNPFG